MLVTASDEGLRTAGPADRRYGAGAIVVWLAAHAALGFVAHSWSLLATIHAVAVVGALVVVAAASRRVEPLVAVTCYAGVCDVLWRMTGARAPWELSKYAVVVGAVAVLVRFVPAGRRLAGAPSTFLLLLVPGMVLTLFALDLGDARDRISGTEMGLVAFAVGALALGRLVASTDDAWNLGWIATGPMVAVLAIVTRSLRSDVIAFGTESSVAASGGFGPNQVSSILGLLVLLCGLLALLPRSRPLWPVLAVLALWAIWAAFLTFSRGGPYSLVLAAGAMALAGLVHRGVRIRSAIILVVGLTALVFSYTSANDYSGSWLGDRYAESGSTGRDTIAQLDVGVFAEHPVLGVGSGRARDFRSSDGYGDVAAHTEPTRVLAEHGVLGLAALALLGVMQVRSYVRAPSHWNRLMVVALTAWSLTTMLHAATRIGAVAVALALTHVRIEEPADERAADARQAGPSARRAHRPGRPPRPRRLVES